MKKGLWLFLGMWSLAACARAETLAFWCFDATPDGQTDLRNAAGTNGHFEARNGDPAGSFRRPLEEVPAWEDLPAATRGGHRNRGSVLFGGEGRTHLRAPGLGRALEITRSFTVEGWLRKAADPLPDAWWYLFGACDAGPGWMLSLRNNAGKACFHLHVNAPVDGLVLDRFFDAADVRGDFDWMHVALVYDAARETNGCWQLFLNGSPRGSLANPAKPGQTHGFADFNLGGRPDGNVFAGQLDLWRVSGEALPPARFLTAHAPQTLAYWPLDVLAGGALDLASKTDGLYPLTPGKDGGVSGADERAVTEVPNPKALRRGARVERANAGCVRLAGDIGRRSLLAAPELGLRCDLTNSFTVEGWYRAEGDPGERFWHLAGARDDANGWTLSLRESAGRIRFHLHVSDVARGGRLQLERFFQDSDVTADAAWRHVALVYDPRRGGVGMWELYLDGVSQGVIANPSAPDRSHGFAGFSLGGRESLSNSFVGLLDCWRVSQGALAPEQFLCSVPDAGPRPPRPSFDDPRDIAKGRVIPDEDYCDQPYVGVMRDGRWVCVLTTGRGGEGNPGQHVVSTFSEDQGRTWSPLTDIEPASGPEASWATCLVTPFDRIYAFYTYNGDNVTTLPGQTNRVKSAWHGWYAFKYSDDGGATWSAERYRIPVRVTDVDRQNPWQGRQCHFWGVDKPVTAEGTVFFAFTKLAKWFASGGEGWVVASDNILTERNAARVRFRLLPEGEKGIRNPAFGEAQEEHNLTALNGLDLMCVCRTDGLPAQSFSRDGGRTWSLPERMTYGPGQRLVKSNRACPKLFKTRDGRYLFWYHNHGVPGWGNRNPVFISGGVLKADGFIRWSEPELLFYDRNLANGISYPDLVEGEGRFWFTETQKSVARVHAADRALLEGLWSQETRREVCRNGLLAEFANTNGAPRSLDVPEAFGALAGGGLSVELTFRSDNMAEGLTLFSTADGRRGVRVSTARIANEPTVQIELSDGDCRAVWAADPESLATRRTHHAVFTCDFAAGVIGVIVDGRYCDGGEKRPFGWGRIPSALGPVAASPRARVAGEVKHIRLYGRALRTSEAIGNFRAFEGP
ncbi:MAG TPA: exo-alpha-sialidase [Kiritimatiellia bacterium]|nr:exo-alpha-sialidase [Kiritimatiellia bacterium]HPS07359.1 exo-alpha-sialidase [Kiritimatiellia bacterium]